MDALEIEARRRALEDARSSLSAATRHRLNSRRPKPTQKAEPPAASEPEVDLGSLASALTEG